MLNLHDTVLIRSKALNKWRDLKKDKISLLNETVSQKNYTLKQIIMRK